jgi:Spy/CpxP family protein refolding chaperone
MEMIEALQAELSLTPAQATEVSAILERYQGQVTHTWETVRPHLRAAMDSVGSEIEAVLAPEQRERFRTWIREQHAPNGSMGGGRGRR